MADFIEDQPPPPPPLSWYFCLTKAELEGVGDLEPSSFEWLLLLTAESHLLSPPLQCLTGNVTPYCTSVTMVGEDGKLGIFSREELDLNFPLGGGVIFQPRGGLQFRDF